MRLKFVIRPVYLAMLALLFLCANVNAAIIDFEDLRHGEIVNDQYTSSAGVSIHAVNIGGGPDLAIAYDSDIHSPRDPDLNSPWDKGNLTGKNLGKVLIIAENGIDINGDGLIDNPDDEGTRPAGSIFLNFNTRVTSFGFDLIDVDGTEEYNDNSGYVAVFYDGDTELGRVGFGAFVDPSSPFYDPSVAFGDNSANRINPITAEELGINSFDRVELNFGGSGAIDNLHTQVVPIPSAVLLLGTGMIGLATVRRKRP